MNEQLEKVAEALRKRGFKAVCCATGAEAHDYVMKEAETAQSVGFGGSVTVKSLGLVEAMAAAGKEILRHGDPTLTPERKAEVMRRELTCDLFLLSANALTLDGGEGHVRGGAQQARGRRARRGRGADQALRVPAELPPPQQADAVRGHGGVRGLQLARPHLHGHGGDGPPSARDGRPRGACGRGTRLLSGLTSTGAFVYHIPKH